ncbi:MAG: WD40 repeat protein [Akkermansiaceae bacterium]|jgi:WD40 repeat protein
MSRLDRKIGECRLSQLIEAGGRWSLSGDARQLFSARWDRKDKATYSLFEVKTNKWLWSFETADEILATTFSEDQKFILVMVSERAAENPVSLVWLDREKGKELRRVKLPGNGKVIPYESHGSVVVDTKEGTFVCKNAGNDHPLYFIDKKKGAVRELLAGQEEFVAHEDNWNVLVQPKTASIVALHHGKTLHLFSNDSGKLTPIHQVQAGSATYVNDDIINVHFNDAGDRLVVGSLQQTVIIDLAKPHQIHKRLDTGSATSDFSADGEFLVFWDRGGAWPFQTKDWASIREERSKKEAFHCCPIEAIAFSPESGLIATGDGHRYLVWSLGDKEPSAQLTSPRGTDGCQMNSLAWGAGGKSLLGSDGWDVLQWDLGQPLSSPGADPVDGTVAFGALQSRSERKMLEVATDASGRYAVVIDRKSATYYDMQNPGASRNLKIDPTDFGYRPRSFQVDGENQRLILSTTANIQLVGLGASQDPFVKKLGPDERILRGRTGEILVLEKSRDRKKVTLHSKKIEDGTTTSSLEIGNGDFHLPSVKVSPDGSLILLGLDNTLVVMDWESKKVLREISSPSAMTSGAISPDNHYVALGATNRAIYLWKIRE